MSRLHIHLQEGFEGDAVVVEVGGRQAYRNDETRTRLQLGLAAMVDVEVPDGAVEVRVRLPGRGLERLVRVDVDGETYLGVGLEEGRIDTRVSRDAFGYV